MGNETRALLLAPKRLDTDRPIERLVEDTLGRSSPAKRLAQNILALDSSHGLVIGVLGPWGSGKTSFMNLVREVLTNSEASVVDFNPWMFSGIDRLVDAFFGEISAALKLLPQLNEAGKELEEYGELLSDLGWIPIVGPWTERARLAMRLFGGGLKKVKGGTAARRRQVERALAKLASPVVVVLDDIDRLTTQEIRQVFQLVRLTASFPNMVYVLAFDRQRVEQALSEDGVPGRAYLEKILQLAIDLPVASNELLQSQTFAAIDSALHNVDNVGELDKSAWPDLYFNIIRPLLTNMRDVKRYALAVRSTAAALDGQVALADVLALEAVRVFMPDFFVTISANVDVLTNVSDGHRERSNSQQQKRLVESLIGSAGDRAEVATATLKELFPASRRHIDNYSYGGDWKARWLRERRVAHESLLRLYLERVVSPKLGAHLAAEQAFKRLGSRAELNEFLRSLAHEAIEDTIGGLLTFEEDFRPEHVVPGVVVLLNLLPDIPERTRSMFDFGTRLTVTRVTYRLLRSLKDQDRTERATRQILPELELLSAKWEVISDVGYHEGSGHRLVSEEVAAQLESEWRTEVRDSSTDRLAADPELLRVFLVARKHRSDSEAEIVVPDAPQITHRLLKSSRSDTISQSLGSYAIHREPRLAWSALVAVYAGEDALVRRVNELLASQELVDSSLEELLRKYLDGWRPESD